jgi:hypothetical protein
MASKHFRQPETMDEIKQDELQFHTWIEDAAERIKADGPQSMKENGFMPDGSTLDDSLPFEERSSRFHNAWDAHDRKHGIITVG